MHEPNLKSSEFDLYCVPHYYDYVPDLVNLLNIYTLCWLDSYVFFILKLMILKFRVKQIILD